MECGIFGIRDGALLCHLTATAFFLLCLTVTVRSQCERGDEGSCRWSNDDRAGTKWVSETTSGESYVRLEKCRTPPCGIGTILSPWLPPSTSSNQLVLYYKIFGYSSVYLKLEHKKENEKLPTTLYQKYANYGDDFPTQWSSATVRVPPSDTTYQLSLKAFTPYSEGFVAVKGVAINEPNSIPSSSSSSTSTPTSTTTRRGVQTSSTTTATTTTTEENDIDFPEDDNESEDNTNGMTEALEDRRFLTVEDFNFGRTTVVYPELFKC